MNCFAEGSVIKWASSKEQPSEGDLTFYCALCFLKLYTTGFEKKRTKG